MNFMDKNRYLELVAKQNALQAENLSLYDINKLEDSELALYQTIIAQQVFYNNRSKYIDLIQKCIDGEINCYAFQWDFYKIFHDHTKIYDELLTNLNQTEISFYTDSKIKKFFLLVEELEVMCEFLDDLVTEEDFYLRMEKVYSNIQKYTESTSGISNDIEVLKFTTIFFMVTTILAYCFLKPEFFSFFALE